MVRYRQTPLGAVRHRQGVVRRQVLLQFLVESDTNLPTVGFQVYEGST